MQLLLVQEKNPITGNIKLDTFEAVLGKIKHQPRSNFHMK